MSKIDWTKPIETLEGRPATLMTILKNSAAPYLIVSTLSDGRETAWAFADSDDTSMPQAVYSIRNVVPPLRLYGRLDKSRGDTEGLGWTPSKGSGDTHVIELTPDDLKRVMRPLSAQEYHDVSNDKIIIRSIAARGTLNNDALAELIIETNGAYYSVIKNRYGMPMENQPILELGQFLSHWRNLDQQRDGA